MALVASSLLCSQDIDAVGDTGKRDFLAINANSTIDSIVMNNRNILVESTSGNTYLNLCSGTSGPDQEKNLSRFCC